MPGALLPIDPRLRIKHRFDTGQTLVAEGFVSSHMLAFEVESFHASPLVRDGHEGFRVGHLATSKGRVSRRLPDSEYRPELLDRRTQISL